MRFVAVRSGPGATDAGGQESAPFATALVEGLPRGGGLYVPETIPEWTPADIAQLPFRSLPEIATRVLRPFAVPDVDEARLAAIVQDALDFRIPLVEVEPGVHALELFHGPTLAFKDVGARVLARLMGALNDRGTPITVLVATSGDTGAAVAHAFHRIRNTRVVVLYPDGRVSPTQEAQLTAFNAAAGANVRAYAVAGSFDDCQRLVREAFGDAEIRRDVRLTSANSMNVGRWLPQMVYYFHAFASRAAVGALPIVSVPSGNFGNLAAGLMAKRAGLPIDRFVAATNVNDVVPAYLATGRFEPRAAVATLANAMDVGRPSNFDRLMWLYDGRLEALRRDLAGSRHDDDEVRAAIRRVYETRGYVLDPHSAIAYLGLRRQPGVFLATAHPAKFGEIVEPIIGRAIEPPPALRAALTAPRRILRVGGSLDAIKEQLVA